MKKPLGRRIIQKAPSRQLLALAGPAARATSWKPAARSQKLFLCDGKRVFEQLNLHRPVGLQVDADNIESKWRVPFDLAQEFVRYADKSALLFLVHGRMSGLEIARGARLDLDEAEDVAVPPNQVQFAPALRAAVVAGHHHVSLPPQIEVSFFFAAPPDVQMLRPGLPARQDPGERVKRAERETSELAISQHKRGAAN